MRNFEKSNQFARDMMREKEELTAAEMYFLLNAACARWTKNYKTKAAEDAAIAASSDIIKVIELAYNAGFEQGYKSKAAELTQQVQ